MIADPAIAERAADILAEHFQPSDFDRAVALLRTYARADAQPERRAS